MNDQNVPPPIPPPDPALRLTRPGNAPPLGENPEDRVPISGIIAAFEAILRQPRRVMYQLRTPGQSKVICALLIMAVVSAAIYGAVVGTFSGGTQLWAAPAKIVTGLLISAFICLPSLYIFSCLSGSQARLVEVFGLLAGLLALMTLLLIGFAPVAWIFSQSTESVVTMGVLHLAFWVIATYFGLRFLHAGFRHLDAGSHSGITVWTIIFLLVALQMTTALRPIIGTADTLLPKEKKFFIAHWIDSIDEASKAKPTKPGRPL